MPERRFRKGDLVRFRMGVRFVQGEVKEDRGPIGVKGRRLYLVEFPTEPQSTSPYQVELPADELQLVQDAVREERATNGSDRTGTRMVAREQVVEGIRRVLDEHTPEARTRLLDVLAQLEQFAPKAEVELEVCPDFFQVLEFETRDELLSDGIYLDEVLPRLGDQADAADVDLHELLGQEVFPWLARLWSQVAVAADGRKGFAFYHGELSPRYEFSQQQWVPSPGYEP
jgi:hypothetical protein